MTFVVASIVEGHGEVAALPVLLRRLEPAFAYPRPVRLARTQMLDTDTLCRYTRLAAANVHDGGGAGAVLIVLDADDDCAATIGPQLAAKAARAGGFPACCVVAVREFEAWFLAGVADLGGPENPEQIRGCKERLRARLGRYSPTVDQPKLASQLDLRLAAERAPSFDKLTRTIEQIRAHADARGDR